ncbi:MAG TPA: FAD-dependent oxidoreductase, partial [Bacteroidia bacterium]|nr:FAD-dependent oxidoreductase [Bacteroidia bacterium]
MKKVAIIGTGIAGMGCGHLLHKKYDLTFYEQNDYVGGHTNTISVTENDKPVFMDTGFMVFNFETYPQLTELFKEIGAPVKKTDMSFSVQYKPTGLEYCGSGVNGLFAQRKNLFSARYIKMLMEISRFNTIGVKILDDARYAKYSLTEFISEFHFSNDMLWQYLIPMSSAVWSTPPDKMLEFPAVTLIRFFKNHGFLGLNTQHQWYTLHNGSRSYRDILVEPFKDRIHTNRAAAKVTKKDNFVRVELADGTSAEFDKVIMATHADQALRLLARPEADETRLLSAFKYQKNS